MPGKCCSEKNEKNIPVRSFACGYIPLKKIGQIDEKMLPPEFAIC